MRRPVPPHLDDRSFEQLRAEALDRIRAVCPSWTDFSPSDPGIALVEVFAYLTQTMLYRLNRVPDKQYRAFLALLGVSELPPAAATTTLGFARTGQDGAIDIPRGTRVAADAVVFSTMEPARLEAGQDQVTCRAFHGELVEGELVGLGTGAAGLTVTVHRPPIVAPMDDGLDLVVAVEESGPIPPEARAVRIGEKAFRIWTETPSFANLREGERVYVVDRLTGVIRFPPAARISDDRGDLRPEGSALGAVPPQGREIRVSYRTGGGAAGNLRAGVLTALRDRIVGLAVTNPAPAAGGRDAESLDNALVRGPTDFHRLERAVTARDYQALARRAAGIARARAFTKADVWRYAAPGVVEVLLVPTPGGSGRHTLADLREQETAEELGKVQAALDLARPLGSRCEVKWTNYKSVSVQLTAVVSRQESPSAVRQRILSRLDQLISPAPRSAWDDGWTHGRALRRYDVEGTVRAEPGVLYVTDVELRPDQLPEGEVATMALDHHEPRTWYVGSGRTIYRTVNGGDGWELLREFSGDEEEQASIVRTGPFHPGLVVAVTSIDQGRAIRIHVSRDCGESWEVINRSGFTARDAALSVRGETPLLFLATDGGLYELLLDGRASPLRVEVDTTKADRGFSSVVVHRDVQGIEFVAAASNDRTGVFLSRDGGATKTFTNIGPKGRDVGELGIQRENVRSYLWAGFAIPGTGVEPGGAARYELALEPPNEGWVEFLDGWEGGSCRALGFTRDGTVVAGSHSQGVLWLAPRAERKWRAPSLDSGLPIRDEVVVGGAQRLVHPVLALAVDTSTANPAQDRVVVGTVRGVFRSPSPTVRYEAVTDRKEFSAALREFVTLPPTWLFCSGAHEVRVVTEGAREDEA